MCSCVQNQKNFANFSVKTSAHICVRKNTLFQHFRTHQFQLNLAKKRTKKAPRTHQFSCVRELTPMCAEIKSMCADSIYIKIITLKSYPHRPQLIHIDKSFQYMVY